MGAIHGKANKVTPREPSIIETKKKEKMNYSINHNTKLTDAFTVIRQAGYDLEDELRTVTETLRKTEIELASLKAITSVKDDRVKDLELLKCKIFSAGYDTGVELTVEHNRDRTIEHNYEGHFCDGGMSASIEEEIEVELYEHIEEPPYYANDIMAEVKKIEQESQAEMDAGDFNALQNHLEETREKMNGEIKDKA